MNLELDHVFTLVEPADWLIEQGFQEGPLDHLTLGRIQDFRPAMPLILYW